MDGFLTGVSVEVLEELAVVFQRGQGLGFSLHHQDGGIISEFTQQASAEAEGVRLSRRVAEVLVLRAGDETVTLFWRGKSFETTL